LAALTSLQEEGRIDAEVVAAAIQQFGIDADKPNPLKS